MSIIRSSVKYQKHSSAAFWLLLLGLGACQTPAAQLAAAPPQHEAQMRESDLRAFCPPVEFAEGAYVYRLYAGGALAAQAAIADITRDCRYDRDNGLIHLQIAAAGRVVSGGSADGAPSLPIAVRIANGSHILFAKTYQQKVVLRQTNAATQFLFAEAISVKLAEAQRGAKITIGFAAANNRAAAQQKSRPAKARTERISPKAGNITIPEAF